MQAVILAGGLGVRLRPVTLQIPKPMVPIRGRPFLEYQIDLVRRHGFDSVLLLVGYLGDQIRRHFGGGEAWQVRIGYSFESSPLGTAGALGHAYDALEGRFLLLNGDTYLDTDYETMMRAAAVAQTPATMAVYDNAEPVAPNNAEVGAGGRVVRYSKQNPEGMTHVDAGAYVLTRDVVSRLADGRVASLETDLLPMLAASGQLGAWLVRHRFYDIGTFDRLELARTALQ